jgi:hypothetical protein
MGAMKTTHIGCLLLTGLLAACSGEEQAPASPTGTEEAPAQEQLADGFKATFQQAREVQVLVLEQASRLLAAGDNVSVQELDAGLVALNRSVLQTRMAITALRKQDTDEARALMKELRTASAKVHEAFNELLLQHPDPESLPAQVLEDNGGQ